mmetsp:Transcript_128067/g.250790  ORF Transcript_128067/g.250790 Transcript_128067/m.250790 type:complete len:200 (-) Transcript_128067:33-632(-)
MQSKPGLRMSSTVAALSSGLFRRYTEKMEPTLTLQSTFEDPSRGSKATQNGPRLLLSVMMIGCSSSSETSRQHTPHCFMQSTQIVFAMMSSFFTSSPVAFCTSARPYRSHVPAFLMAFAQTLQACCTAFISSASCWSPVVSSTMNCVRVKESMRFVSILPKPTGSGACISEVPAITLTWGAAAHNGRGAWTPPMARARG